MSYNGSGTFQINTSGQPVVTGTVISSTAFNALTADLANGLSTAITKDGQTATTVRIPFAQGINSTLATDSTSTGSGSIITAGGVGIAKNAYIGGNANIAGTLDVTGVTTVQAGTAAAPAIITTGDTNTGIFFPAADTIAFSKGGAEAMRINSSGNVGIGTTTPAATLNVYNATSATFQLDGDSGVSSRVTRYSTDTTGPTNVVRKARGTLASPTAVATGDESGGFYMQSYGGTNFRNVARIDGLVQTYTSDTNIAGALRFYTNNSSTDVTEWMRITSTGRVGIGTASPVSLLQVGSSVINNTALTVASTNNTAAQINLLGDLDSTYGTNLKYEGNGNYFAVSLNNAGALTEQMRIDTSGNLTVPAMYGTTVTTPRNVFIDSTGKMGGISSVRASKSNITPVTDSSWLYQVSPVTFNYRKRDNEGNYLTEVEEEIQYGLIAEDVEAVKPEFCIYVEKDGKQVLQGVHYDRMISPLIKSIQEQQVLITSLTARVATLENNTSQPADE